MSGELPRPIKGTSLHHPHASYTISTHNPNTPNAYHYSPYSYISTAPAPLPHQLSHASSSLARPASGSARRGEFAVPALPHRSLDRAATSAAQSSVFSHSSGSDIPPMPGLVYSATPGAPAGAKRGRRPHIGERHDAIWSQEVQDAFLQAARSIPNNGKNWIMRDGRQYGRNALIAEEIFRLTGQQRTRQQISSHIQVLKKVHADDTAMMRILNGQLEEESSNAGQAGAPTSAPLSRVGSSASSPSVVKTEDQGSSISPPPTFASDPIEDLLDGQSYMSVIRSNPPTSNPSENSLPGTPQSPPSGVYDSGKQPLQLAELLPRSATPPPPIGRALSEPLVADRPEKVDPHPGAWRGERLAYITAITIWAERTLNDAGIRSRPTTTHVYAQMHSATCPLESLPDDMAEIVRQIGPGTCMHAEIGIALPPAGINVGKIKATLVIEAMKEFDGYCLTDAFCADEGRFMSTHTTVFPTGREAREKYSWTYEIPYATEVWKKVLTKSPQAAHGMRLVQKYVRSLAGGNRNGDVNVALMVVHDIHVVPPGEVGYSRIKHVDLTGEQAKHDAMGVSVTVKDDSEDGSGSDGDVKMEMLSPELSNRRAKPNLSVAIPPAEEERLKMRTRQAQLAGASQPVTPFDQLVHTPQHPPPLANHGQEIRRGWLWAPTPTEGSVPGGVGMKTALGNDVHGMMGGMGDGGNRMAWLTRDALAAGTPTLAEFAGRDHEMEGDRLAAPVRIDQGGMQGNEYFPMH